WEQIKAAEKERASAMDDVPRSLPALLYAHKLGRRAAAIGFDWPPGDPGVVEKVHSEVAELEAVTSPAEQEEELGDVLFAVVNWARHLKVDPEAALRRAAAKFEGGVRLVEVMAAAQGVELAEAVMDALDE